MRTFTLPSGREIGLEIRYGEKTIGYWQKGERFARIVKTTTIHIHLPAETRTITAEAVLNHQDQFSRAGGRKAALHKLLRAMMPDVFGKADRTFLWAKVCPGYARRVSS
jgi:hypothetical protein